MGEHRDDERQGRADRPSVVYELRSVNLASLAEKEQGSVLDRFASFLDSLTGPISFHVVQDDREVESIGAVYRIRTGGSSCGLNLSPLLW